MPERETDRKDLEGVGIWLGVLARVRGVVLKLGVMAREGVCAREGVLRVKIGMGGWNRDDDCVVETEEVIGDHGRDDATEALETLLR